MRREVRMNLIALKLINSLGGKPPGSLLYLDEPESGQLIRNEIARRATDKEENLHLKINWARLFLSKLDISNEAPEQAKHCRFGKHFITLMIEGWENEVQKLN